MPETRITADLPAPSCFERLVAVSMAERVRVLEAELCGWAGRAAGLSPAKVEADFRLQDLQPDWFAGGDFFRELESFITNELGFSGFYEAELVGRSDLRSLASYLAGEVDLPPERPRGTTMGAPTTSRTGSILSRNHTGGRCGSRSRRYSSSARRAAGQHFSERC